MAACLFGHWRVGLSCLVGAWTSLPHISPSVSSSEAVCVGTQVTEAVAKKHWDFWYEWLLKKCAHGAECKT